MSIGLKPSRYPSRASEDMGLIHHVLDAGLFCTIAFNRDGIPHQIPTGYCRIDDKLYIHASSKSHFIEGLIGQMVSFSVTHLDALILAPTAFDHSFNYRSVIGFSVGREITDPVEKLEIFRVFTDRYVPHRIADVGDPTPEQVGITRIVELSLDKAGIKMRNAGVNVENAARYGKWIGVVPIHRSYGEPVPDEQIAGVVELPNYIAELVK